MPWRGDKPVKRNEKKPPYPKYATVTTYETGQLLHGERVELFWDFQPTDHVSFSLPASCPVKVGDQLVLLAEGWVERPVWVLAVGPSRSHHGYVGVDARGYDPSLMSSLRRKDQPKEPVSTMNCPMCSRTVSVNLNKCICGHYESCSHCYRAMLPDDGGNCPHCHKPIVPKTT
jgi:hypothetical protein